MKCLWLWLYVRWERDKKKKGDPVPTKDTKCRVPIDFTACLAHVEITELQSNGQISWIAGYLVHNEGYKSSVLKWLPTVPLHDHVYEVALDQLEKGARWAKSSSNCCCLWLSICCSITAIQRLNWEIMEKQAYQGMDSFNPKTANIWYQFLPSDNVTLYRKFSCQNGVDVHWQPEYNVHNWLDPLSPNFQHEISNAIFHYPAQSEVSKRFWSASQQKTWMLWHGNMHTAPNLFSMVHLGFVTQDSSFLLRSLRMRIGRGFPLLSFFSPHQQGIKRHMQVIIWRSWRNFFHIGTTTSTVSNPQKGHSHLTLQ